MNCMFLNIPSRCKIEQPDTQQCYGIKNSEMEMCMWVVLLRYLETTFIEDKYNIKSLLIRNCFLQKLLENKMKQKRKKLLK